MSKITEFRLEDLYVDDVSNATLERVAERVKEIDEELNGFYYETTGNWNIAKIELINKRLRIRMESETIPKQIRFMIMSLEWLFDDVDFKEVKKRRDERENAERTRIKVA